MVMKNYKHDNELRLDVFPRRIRNTTPCGNNPIILRSYLRIRANHFCQLIASPDELRKVIRESIKDNYNFFSGELSDPKFDIKQEADW